MLVAPKRDALVVTAARPQPAVQAGALLGARVHVEQLCASHRADGALAEAVAVALDLAVLWNFDLSAIE